MNVTERLDAIEARAAAATEGPWQMDGPWTLGYTVITSAGAGLIDADDAGSVPCLIEEDAEFIAHARADVPDLVAALRAVHKPQIVESPTWLSEIGDVRSIDPGEFGGDPGNAAYMAYLHRVLSAAYPNGFRWGPVILAIILDRHVRATEDDAAITAALDGTR